MHRLNEPFVTYYFITCFVILVLIETDVPGSPSAPTISKVTADSAVLSWSPPSSDGGARIIGYTIEMRTATSPRWVKATLTPTPDTDYRITRLVKGSEYEFRVIAVNRVGPGKPSEPSHTITIESPAGKYHF